MKSIEILIVDDEPGMRAFIKASLKSSFPGGLEIYEAGGGEIARDKLAIKRFDIIICDYNMPGMKGTDLLAWVKEQDHLKDTQFMMLTASKEKEIVMNAVNLGVNDFIIKPVSVDILSKKLEAAINATLAVRKKEAGVKLPDDGSST